MHNFRAGRLGGDLFDRERRAQIADGLAAAASLPWSTTATAVTAWFVVLVSALEIASLRPGNGERGGRTADRSRELQPATPQSMRDNDAGHCRGIASFAWVPIVALLPT